MSFRPKLIALDVDGTLLDGESRLTARTKKALREALRQGIHVSLATGRMYPSALPLIQEIGSESPCVFYNGAVVRRPGAAKAIYRREIGAELTSEIVNFYREHGWYIQMYENDRLVVEDRFSEECRFYENIAKIEAVSKGACFWNQNCASTKLLGISLDGAYFKEMYRLTKERFDGRLYIATSWHAFVEMVHPIVNKAHGLAIAAEAANVAREDVLAFGDGSNDKEMLAWAGLGVAMSNGADATKAAADEIAPSNDEDGAAQVIERYL